MVSRHQKPSAVQLSGQRHAVVDRPEREITEVEYYGIGRNYRVPPLDERGIHLIWIPHDVMDPRTVSRREMREAFSQYMVTVLNEKPLDPTLLDYEDTLSW